ncbi:MAG TPA: hypothetical protein VE913_14145 [Longimicrobium sp.]|nr:hypothetical protein [Longimicrobium sp.]
MPAPTLDDAAREAIRAELESLGGVRRAIVDGGAEPRVYLVCERADGGPTEALARAIMVSHGLHADAELLVATLPHAEPRRRVRFMAARVSTPRPGHALAEVELEWDGTSYVEQAEGEGGTAVELRLAALATLRTLHGILGGRVRFELMGIKSLKAFDAEVVVAVLRHVGADAPSLIGAALASGNLHRSAALSVLNATNRVLGNYLTQVQE